MSNNKESKLNNDSFVSSKNKVDRIEISVRSSCGKMCDYCPQDRYINAYKHLSKSENKSLTLEMMRLLVVNIPVSTQIRWTGFTEPFDFSEFPDIVAYLNDLGYEQVISTTLLGPYKSQSFFIENLAIFKYGITLHLPDQEGLMKGRFNDVYAEYVENVLRRLRDENIKYEVFLIGDDLHNSVKGIVEKHVKDSKNPNSSFVKAKYLNTRVGAIDASLFRLRSSDAIKKDGVKYHCAYRRLNQGVLLPNGSVALCCQDYGLELVLGNLKEASLTALYSTIEDDPEMREQFESGKLAPCVRCEHYRPIDSASTTGRKE